MKFLITSSLDVETVGTASNILLTKQDLGPLDVAESIEILKDIANLRSNTDTETKAKLREIAEICENIPLALRLAGPLLAMESEYAFDGLKHKLQQNPVRTLGVKPIMEIAFEKLDESFQHALVSLSVFLQSFKRDAAESILGDDCANGTHCKAWQRQKRQKTKGSNRTKKQGGSHLLSKSSALRQTYYGEHVVTALAHKDLAGHYLAMKDFCKAEENYEAAVRILEGALLCPKSLEKSQVTDILEYSQGDFFY